MITSTTPASPSNGDPDRIADGASDVRVPIVEESVEVSRERVTTGHVRIAKRVRVHDAIVDEPVLHDAVRVERRTVDRVVDTPPPVRQEGDTTIVPVLEEVIVVEKRLVLKEELLITRVKSAQRHVERVALRREEAEIERVEAPSSRPESVPAEGRDPNSR